MLVKCFFYSYKEVKSERKQGRTSDIFLLLMADVFRGSFSFISYNDFLFLYLVVKRFLISWVTLSKPEHQTLMYTHTEIQALR